MQDSGTKYRKIGLVCPATILSLFIAVTADSILTKIKRLCRGIFRKKHQLWDEVSGVDEAFAVMGGFHLTGPGMAPVIEPTVQGLKEIDPAYVIPTHCTGRDAIMQIEKEMPEKFILNMAGTKFIFSGIQKENLWKTNYNHGLIFG